MAATPELCLNPFIETRLSKPKIATCPQAVDLKEMREVAVKVHQLDPSWAEDRKASYVKHAVRPSPPPPQVNRPPAPPRPAPHARTHAEPHPLGCLACCAPLRRAGG